MSGGVRPDRVRGWGSLLLPVLVSVLAVGLPTSKAIAAEASGTGSSAQRLVADALRAEAAGNAARHDALLDEAVGATPDNNLAHWSRGEILAGGRWLPVDEAQRAAANDPRHLEYLSLRASYGDRPEAQLDLARWCRRNNLNDEARIHWANVLAHEPNNEEALRALGASWFRGRLLTYAQIDAAKRDIREIRKAAKEFKPRSTKWQRMLSAGDVASREAALDEVRSITSVDAIPALEEVTLRSDIETTADQERCRYLGLAFVEALDGMPDPAAAASLARHAVLSPISDVRETAVEGLKKRPMQDYVPLLLDALAMPIETTFQVTTDPDGSVHYRHSLYVDGRRADWSLENARTVWQRDLRGGTTFIDREGKVCGYGSPLESDAQVAGEIAAVAGRSRQQFAAEAATVEQQVAQMNEVAAALNKRVIPVLVKTTGQDLSDNPQDWWSWWQRYNEYYSEGEDLVNEQRYSQSSHRYYREPSTRYYTPSASSAPGGRKYVVGLVPRGAPARRETRPIGTRAPVYTSCFARGTPVWTNTGKRAIETLQIGDLVLAQNVDTGELAYQPVVGRTVRPPSPILKINLGKDELHTTLGHPLWVSGIGWRMAKEVGEAAVLHGVHGPVRVDEVEADAQAEGFNLVVADFNTYFVGESGILVHDNTSRQPTAAVVPGLVPK